MTAKMFEIIYGFSAVGYGALVGIFAGLCAWWGSRHPEKKPQVWRLFTRVTLAGASLGLLTLAALFPAECLRPSPPPGELAKYLFGGISLVGLALIIAGGVWRYLGKKNACVFIYCGLVMMMSLAFVLPSPVGQMVFWALVLPMNMEFLWRINRPNPQKM